jgi:hypothetical protein
MYYGEGVDEFQFFLVPGGRVGDESGRRIHMDGQDGQDRD